MQSEIETWGANKSDRRGRENIKDEGLGEERTPSTREERPDKLRWGRWEGTFYNKLNFKFIATNFRWVFRVWLLPDIISYYPVRLQDMPSLPLDSHLSTHIALPGNHIYQFYSLLVATVLIVPFAQNAFLPIFHGLLLHLLQICAQILTSQRGLFLFKIQLYLNFFPDLWFSKYYAMHFITSYICFVTYVLAGTFVCFVHYHILPA